MPQGMTQAAKRHIVLPTWLAFQSLGMKSNTQSLLRAGQEGEHSTGNTATILTIAASVQQCN